MILSNFKKLFFNLIIVIFLIVLFQLPKNSLKLINFDYENRLNQIYGYCYPQGYGFIKEIEKEYNLKNVQTINFKDFAESDFFLNNPSKKQLKDYKILINYDVNENTDYLLDDFEVIFNKQKCYLIKND